MRINGLRKVGHRAETLSMERTRERTATTLGFRAHSVPYIRLADSMLPAIHRWGARGAILRDDRLEIAIDDNGGVIARVVSGADH
jgi:hypothetical protein